MPTKQAASFRLDPRHLKVLRALTDLMSRQDGTNYSQAQIVERAIACLWHEETNEHIYTAFAKDEE